MTIRRAVASDLDGLAGLRAELLRDTFTRPYPPPPWEERLGIFEQALEEGLLFVAEDEAGLAGFALGDIPRAPVGGIVYLHVRADARRQGVGHSLAAELVTALEAAGAEWIHIEVENDNADAGAIYERWGFQPCGSILLSSTAELRKRL